MNATQQQIAWITQQVMQELAAQGQRADIMQHVVVRATQASVLELHVDVEEANAYGLRNGDLVNIITEQPHG